MVGLWGREKRQREREVTIESCVCYGGGGGGGILVVSQDKISCVRWFVEYVIFCKTSLGGTCKPRVAPLSEKIKIKCLFEEKWNHVFKFRVTILIYEYLFVLIVS